jgi:hypothetical protein
MVRWFRVAPPLTLQGGAPKPVTESKPAICGTPLIQTFALMSRSIKVVHLSVALRKKPEIGE